MGLFSGHKQEMVTEDRALPGRSTPMAVPDRHLVLGTPLSPPFPEGTERAIFAMGCFWGAERKFWETDGVYTTAVGYAGGFTPNPTYEEVCSGRTGHAEVVLVVFDPARTSYEALLAVFFEGHDPTQGMRQGNDVGHPVPLGHLHDVRRPGRGRPGGDRRYQRPSPPPATERSPPRWRQPGPSTTPRRYHQQYLAANPGGYCGLGGTGVSCPSASSAVGPRVARPRTRESTVGQPRAGRPDDRLRRRCRRHRCRHRRRRRRRCPSRARRLTRQHPTRRSCPTGSATGRRTG